ncbi:MAG: YafY family transcriptional regulator, partial [Ktedonobacterales bacterium]|nr:YafY family transcriptional regulator [Ktedonobacterales bacterium]
MNRTDRLLAIVLELQGKGRQRAEDLAATFETSKRTIYRDIQALGQAGVPLISMPGRGYALMAGYFLPPLSFTADEAVMLLLGSEVMAASFDVQYGAAARAAGRKIAGVLPERLRADVTAAREGIHFIAQPGRHERQDGMERLRLLRGAILNRHRVRFRYSARYSAHTPSAHTPSAREANPYTLTHIQGTWYLTAYCHERQDMRTFRLDRMDDLM